MEQVLRQTQERDHQAQVEKARLLSLLETEQQARRDLEQKLLPSPPKTAATGNTRQWILLVLLVIVLAVLVVSLIHPELVGRLIGSEDFPLNLEMLVA